MSPVFLGLSLLLLAGAMNGSFTLPMKFTRGWAWENTWLAWTLFALVAYPGLLTLLTVPHLGQVYSGNLRALVFVAVCGACWGASQVFLGLAVEAIGMALSLSVILGLSAAVGSLVPLLTLHAEKIFTLGGGIFLLGILLVLAGVGLGALAGRSREAASQERPAGGRKKASLLRGLGYCLISGIGSALVNFGLAFGGPLIAAAKAAGATATAAPNGVWLPLMLAGAVPNSLYSLVLMRRHRTAFRFREPGTGHYWGLAAIMAVCWFGSTVLYGVAAVHLGDLGPVLGWPLYMSLIVMTATLLGVATGEWKHAGRRPLHLMFASVGVLVAAIFVLSLASRWT
ncbi:MAG: hypothetical protein JST79_20030 [Acidobacteria bacterium]|nr:hypothetical protein [Acidobacteriota bacterium]